jgi:hypothetical protein
MIQIEFFNRLDLETKEHHIDDTYIVVGPIDSFQWTYGHLRLVVDGGEIDLVRFKNSGIYYKGILFGDFRIAPYDATNKNVEKFG